MPAPKDFCAFILTHGRADRVQTYSALRRSGYTGPIRLIVDDGDKQLGEYLAKYPGEVEVFSKAAAAESTDEGDNLGIRGSVIYACATDRPFSFFAAMNDDVTTYVVRGMRGELFYTVMQAQLIQGATQKATGGLTELYLEMGTYVKSFYTVMFAPSCTKIGEIGDPAHGQAHHRIHHAINWHRAVPKLIPERFRKAGRS